jgi:error-prone DNA polymerase
MTSDYVELHARSAFSFLEGSSVPEELVARASTLDFPALAILDRDNISGAARFHMAAKKAGLRAHMRTHRRRNHLHRRSPLSAAGGKSHRLSEPVQIDHAHENARQKGRRRSGT